MESVVHGWRNEVGGQHGTTRAREISHHSNIIHLLHQKRVYKYSQDAPLAVDNPKKSAKPNTVVEHVEHRDDTLCSGDQLILHKARILQMPLIPLDGIPPPLGWIENRTGLWRIGREERESSRALQHWKDAIDLGQLINWVKLYLYLWCFVIFHCIM